MLGTLVRNLLRPRSASAAPLRLHIGGQVPHPDWKIVNVVPSKVTDCVRSCTDLSPFADGSVTEIYASHVLEHLGYQRDLPRALREFHRVLVAGGLLRVSVPDLTTLCELFLDPALNTQMRLDVMRMMFGGQRDEADFHYVGLTAEFLGMYLDAAGFIDIKRVKSFNLFKDTSTLVVRGRPISVNVVARRPPR